MKSFAFLSLFVSLVAAQGSSSGTATSSTAASPTTAANPLIPTGISSKCTTFLTALNANTELSSCIQPIVSATAQFGPSGSKGGSVSSALGSLCSASGCDSSIRTQLGNFYSACQAEVSGSTANKDVLLTYDVLYLISPFFKAVCSKDDSGKFCVNQIASGSAAGGSKSAVDGVADNLALVQNLATPVGSSLARRAADSTAALLPNATTFRENNIAFLMLQASTSSDELCVSCSRQILSAYINFEQSVPYGPGIANSPIMGNQPALYNAVTSTCGANFMNGTVLAAGGLSGGLAGSGALTISPNAMTSVVSLIAAAGAGLAAFL